MNRITTCPKCSGQLHRLAGIRERTLICPHCHTPFSPIDYDLHIPAFGQRDFRRGRGVRYWILMGLIVLNVLCIVWTCLAVPSSPHPINNRSILLFLQIAVLDVLVSVFCWMPFDRYMTGGMLRTVRGVLGFFFLSLGIVIGVVIFFGFVCATFLLP
jgi:hypothetical protein